MEVVEALKRVSLVLALTFPAMAGAMEGVPPTFWFAGGGVVEDGGYSLSIRPEFGRGAGFVGGSAPRSLQAETYLAVPITFHYGFLQWWEAYFVLPWYYGESPQEYVDHSTLGAPAAIRRTLKGDDFGDSSLMVKWQAWVAEEGNSGLFVHLGTNFPMGMNAFQDNMYNFYSAGGLDPRLAFGDGAFEALFGLEWGAQGESLDWEALLGGSYRFPFRADAMDTDTGEITVYPPALAVAKGGCVLRGGETGWWVSGSLEGYWCPPGRIVGGGYMEAPGALSARLDSYLNLVRASAGAWAVLGGGWGFSKEAGVGMELKAPLVVERSYRYWRAGVTLTYGRKLI